PEAVGSRDRAAAVDAGGSGAALVEGTFWPGYINRGDRSVARPQVAVWVTIRVHVVARAHAAVVDAGGEGALVGSCAGARCLECSERQGLGRGARANPEQQSAQRHGEKLAKATCYRRFTHENLLLCCLGRDRKS